MRKKRFFAFVLQALTIASLLSLTHGAAAQEGAPNPSAAPAKELFGALSTPANLPSAAYGGHARGCLAGGKRFPDRGPGWQTMRPERNRSWGHPALIDYLKDLSEQAKSAGWPGILVGDMAQPRGGPMLTGHASHNLGLDADIWMRPAPEDALSEEARNTLSSWYVVEPGSDRIDRTFWSPLHGALLRLAARDERVARIFVSPAIKVQICRELGDSVPESVRWLRKIRPWWGHRAHFHVRLRCPEGNRECRNQHPPPPGDGCAEAQSWIDRKRPPPEPPDYDLLMADLPLQCRLVLHAR